MMPPLERRVGAIVLTHLACELAAREGDARDLPLAVVDAKHDAHTDEEAELGNVLLAVNDAAHKFGVRAGQTVAEARSRVAGLAVRGLTGRALGQALGRVAEIALSFGPTVAIETGDPSDPLDTVWVDLTSTSHLFGGEEAALFELASRVRELGHRVRAAIADGPRLARAASLFATSSEIVVPPNGGQAMMRDLPIEALPISRERAVWLHRLGLWTVGDLAALPARALAGRLVDRGATADPWRESLELAEGRDDAPLVAYEPPSAPSESVAWDEPMHTIEPLLFALRGLVGRLSARLEGRGEASQSIELWAPYDRSIAKLRNVPPSEQGEAGLYFRIELPSPLFKKSDFFRVLKSKLEQTTLAAPVTRLSITARMLTRAPRLQLWMGTETTIQHDPGAMAVLLAELSAEIGPDNVGVLAIDPVHRPEGRTHLVAIDDLSPREQRGTARGSTRTRAEGRARGAPAEESAASDVEFPTRLLPKPIPLEWTPGGRPAVAIDNQLYTWSGSRHSMRFDRVDWWTASPLSRDYARVWLSSGKKHIEAWVYTDRHTGRSYLHGYYD
jgi:protein ImuB